MNKAHALQNLIDAPLSDACKINLPKGRRATPRANIEYGEEIGAKLTKSEVATRRKSSADAKLAKLFDYYAGTDLSAERVAEHMGVHKQVQVGTEFGKPVYERVPDVEKVERELAWRRASK